MYLSLRPLAAAETRLHADVSQVALVVLVVRYTNLRARKQSLRSCSVLLLTRPSSPKRHNALARACGQAAIKRDTNSNSKRRCHGGPARLPHVPQAAARASVRQQGLRQGALPLLPRDVRARRGPALRPRRLRGLLRKARRAAGRRGRGPGAGAAAPEKRKTLQLRGGRDGRGRGLGVRPVRL